MRSPTDPFKTTGLTFYSNEKMSLRKKGLFIDAEVSVLGIPYLTHTMKTHDPKSVIEHNKISKTQLAGGD